MNYIKEINAFYMEIETNPLSASAVALWHALMQVNNRARWIEEFTVAAQVLFLKSGLPESTFKRARLELRDKGFIVYTSRGSQAPAYQMISLVKDLVVVEEVEEIVDEAPVVVEKNLETAALLRDFVYWEDGVQENILSYHTFEFYETHFGEPSQHVVDELFMWVEKIGNTLVYQALVRAVESGSVSWNYTLGILKNWRKDNLLTLEDVMEAEDRFRKKRRFGNDGRPGPENILPDWFRGRSHVG